MREGIGPKRQSEPEIAGFEPDTITADTHQSALPPRRSRTR